jgi:SAM-dependent methyltransferase
VGSWNRYHVDALATSLVASLRPARLLDLGCANGRFGRAIRARETVGVEIDSELAAEAARFYTRVFVGNAEDPTVQTQVAAMAPFDVILASDFVEHLARPEIVLRWCGEILGPDGRLIMGVPNIVYWRERFALLRGRFETTEAGGLYDATHLHFFSLRELVRLVERSALEIDSLVAAPKVRRGERIAQLPFPLPSVYQMAGALSFKFAQRRPALLGCSFLAVTKPIPEGSIRGGEFFGSDLRKGWRRERPTSRPQI